MGLTTAHALKNRGTNTLACLTEKGAHSPPGCASLMAGGMLSPLSEIENLDIATLKAAQVGIEFWKSLPQDKTGFSKTGSLLVAHNQDDYMLERFKKKLSAHKGWSNVNKNELAVLEPALAVNFSKAIFIPDEAFVNPAQVMRALASEVAPQIVDKIDVGQCRNKFDWVIDCRGFGAAKDDPDLRGVKGEAVIVRNKDLDLKRPVRLMHPRYPFYIVPRPGHEFMIGATVIESADNTTTLKSVMELLSAAYSFHPSFGEAEIISIMAGIRPAYPDNLPRITVDGNIIRCNGLFRHGYLLAPVMAQCVADYIAGKKNEFMPLFLREKNDNDQRRTKTAW